MHGETNSSLLHDHVFQKKYFSWYDYSLFSIMLTLSVMIGIYFGYFGKKQSTAKDYLLGGKTMQILPIAMSMVACHVSGITVLAVPADIYKFGSNYSLVLVGTAINVVMITHIFLPVFHQLQITSTYEYLKLRFDTKTRILASFLYALYTILYLPIVVYIPALAFAEATPVNLRLINPIICVICVFYTTIGGLKAVVWTDTLQLSVMLGAMVAVLVIGITTVGGFGVVWDRALEGGRLDLDFDFNPTKRDTFWATLIGWTVNWIPHVGIGQGSVQKYLALPNLPAARKAAVIFGFGMILSKVMSIYTGLIIYAKYFNCDPFLSSILTHSDQLLPHYIMDVASNIPGLSGLFIAGIFCAALSTLSASMNSLSGTIYEDFISRFLPKNISQQKVSQILKVTVIIIGIIATSLVFIVEHLGGLLALSISLSGVTSGPLLGLFLLGMFFPFANAKGAFIGTISSLICLSWIVIGAQIYKSKGLLTYTPKPLSTAGCDVIRNATKINDTVHTEDDIFFLYRITYYYYSLIGVIIVLAVGLPISWCTKRNDAVVDKKLITPCMHWTLRKREADTKKRNDEKDLAVVHEEKEETESMLGGSINVKNSGSQS